MVLAIILIVGLGNSLALAKASKSPPPAPPVEKTEFGTPMNFTVLRLSSKLCEPNCPEWIAADGEITDQTPAKLTKLLNNPSYRKLPIVLNSPGGKVDAAMIMGRMIRKYGMDTGVATSMSVDCTSLQNTFNRCSSDANVHNGVAFSAMGYCNSACTLMLLGGRVRVAAPNVTLGLHQPHGESQRWVDHYWDTWRMVNGKKKIISHRFIKRTYEKPIAVVGVSAQSKPRYLQYFKEMGASPLILDEMAKASPANLNPIPYVKGEEPRKKLGLVTDNDLDVSYFVSADHCKTENKSTSNCVFIKDNVALTPPQSATPCFILSGCGGATKQETVAKGVPCFTATGCSDADKIATQEWLKNREIQTKQEQAAKAEPCFIESGCSKPDTSAAQDAARNGEAEMTFRVMRLNSEECEPRCPEWIAAEGWIVKDTAKKFDAFLSNTGVSGLPVFLQSKGGDFSAAMEMGRIIHKNGLVTAVANSSISDCPNDKSTGQCDTKDGVVSPGFGNVYEAYCERACVVVLLAGRNRTVALDSIVGVEALLPANRIPFEEYLTSVGQTFEIVKAMDAARLSGEINNIADFNSRYEDGLVSKPFVSLSSLIGDHKCQTSGTISNNCVDLRTAKKP